MLKYSHASNRLFYLPKKRKPNYELKAKVIELGLTEDLKQISKSKWKYGALLDKAFEDKDYDFEYEYIKAFKHTLNPELCNWLENKIKKTYSPEYIKEAQRVNDASYHRVKRLKTKISKMLSNKNCVFITLTFDPKKGIFDTSPDTRKQYVRKYLKNESSCYVANIDYGELNGQEHYHALVINRVNPLKWKYGTCNVKMVRGCDLDTSVRIAKYISKLTNHAIKATTKRSCIIYSRT